MDATTKSFTEMLHVITGYLEAKDPENARLLCEKMLRQVKDQPQLWHCYGIALRELGHITEALIPLHKAVGLNPKLAGAWLNLAITELLLEKYEDAEISLTQVLQILPRHPTAQFHLAVLYQKQQRYTLARELYDELLMTQPNNINVVLNLASLLQEQGEPHVAKRLYQRALTLQPGNKQAIAAIEVIDGVAIPPVPSAI